MSGFPLGRCLAVIDAIPRELLRDPNASEPDYRIVAEHLDLAARKVWALAALRPEQSQRSPSRTRRAA